VEFYMGYLLSDCQFIGTIQKNLACGETSNECQF
jgi:hypothetical protein